MRKRIPLAMGIGLLSTAMFMLGCDPNKGNENTTKPSADNNTAAVPSDKAPDAAPSNSDRPAEFAGAPKYKVITNGISPFWTSMTKGLYQADVDLKVNGDWQAPTDDNNAGQVKVIQDTVAAKTNGIAISVIEADALVSTINDPMKQGIPVITFDSDSEKSNRLCYLGTVNFEAGRQAGLASLKLFPNGGKLVAFVGNMSAQNARDRFNGFSAALKGSKVSFIREPYEDQKDANSARKNVEDAITKYGSQVNGLVGLYSYNGPAIVNAVMTAKLRDKIKIICFDGEPDTLSNLKKGLVDVTVVQKPYEFGRLSIMLLNLLHKDKNIDAALAELQPELDKLGMKLDKTKHTIDTGVEVVTPANATEFLDKLKKLGLTST